MKVLVGAFNQEKALAGAFSVIVKTGCGTDGALHSTTQHPSRDTNYQPAANPGLPDQPPASDGDICVTMTFE